MNSGNSQIFEPHKRLPNLSDKINLNRNDKYVALSNFSIYYTWKNIKGSYENNKYQLQSGIINLSYLTDHILYLIFKIILNIS